MAANRKNGRHLTNYKGDLYHRHYCTTCDSRCYPYDSMESLTVAPEIGASKRQILLFSANNYQREKNPNDISRTAWCWRCNKWTSTYRENRLDTELRYLKRNGVMFRFPNGKIEAEPAEKTFVKALDNRIEERRAGAGTISVRR